MSTHQQLDEQSMSLYRIGRTVVQMLRDREYVVVDVELLLSKDQFSENFGDEPKREDLVLRKTKRSNHNEQIFVFFPEEAKVGVKTIKTYAERLKAESVARSILVVQQNLAPFARQCVSEMSSKYHLEVLISRSMYLYRSTKSLPARKNGVQNITAANIKYIYDWADSADFLD